VSDEEVKGVSTLPLWIGGLLTLVYLGIVFCFFREKVLSLRDRTLNEAGDFSAGLFAPLAFLWLVLSLWMQRAELSQNTEVLKNQLKELKFTVKHQEDIAWATVAELNKEKPYLYVERVKLTFNEKDSEYHLHFELKNSGGALRQAIFKLKYSNISKAVSENEIAEEDYELCIRVATTEVDQTHLNTLWSATLIIQGIDVHRQPYNHKAEFPIDYPEFHARLENAKASESKFATVYTELDIEVHNIFSDTIDAEKP